MIAHGLNATGLTVGSRLNPGPTSPFDPVSSPSRVIADGAGVTRLEGEGGAVTMLTADGSGMVRTMADGASVTELTASGAGIVRVDAKGSES